MIHPIRRYKAWKNWKSLAHSMNWFEKILVLLKFKSCTWFEQGWCNWKEHK